MPDQELAQAPTVTAASREAAARPAMRLFQRVPWLWYERVVAPSGLPPWVLALGVFAVLYGLGCLAALAAGDLPRFVRDLRWLGPLGLPAWGALVLGAVLPAVRRIKDQLDPWTQTPEEQRERFWRDAPGTLGLLFPAGFVLWGGLLIVFGVMTPDNNQWVKGYPNPERFRLLYYVVAPAMGYFFGSAMAVVVAGVALFARKLRRSIDLRRGMVQAEGANILRPFRRLIWVLWGGLGLPGMFTGGLVAGLEASRSVQGQQVDPVTYLPPVMLGVIFLLALLIPQLSINGLLAREKREEEAALREDFRKASSLPDGAEPAEGMRRLLRQQEILQDMRVVAAFKPLVVDARLLAQIGLSMVGIFVANVLLPLALERVLS